MGDGAKEVAEMFAAAGVIFDFVLDEGLMVLKGVVPSHEKPVAMVGVVEKVRGCVRPLPSHPTHPIPLHHCATTPHPSLPHPCAHRGVSDHSHSTPSHSTPFCPTPVHIGGCPTSPNPPHTPHRTPLHPTPPHPWTHLAF
jgi:hypothetical protein